MYHWEAHSFDWHVKLVAFDSLETAHHNMCHYLFQAWKGDKPLMGRCDNFVAEVPLETIETAKNKDITMGEFCFLKTTKQDTR
jgi:hypothetical protein